MPAWFQGDVLDVKSLVIRMSSTSSKAHAANRKRRSMKIPAQLKALGLPTFEGRQHSGIDDYDSLFLDILSSPSKHLVYAAHPIM